MNDDHFVNITEQIDDDGNVIDYKLEKIDPSAAENAFGGKLNQDKKKHDDLEDLSKDKGKLAYKKGFLSSSSSSRKAKPQKQDLKAKDERSKLKDAKNENYADDNGSDLTALLRDMGIDDNFLRDNKLQQPKITELEDEAKKGSGQGTDSNNLTNTKSKVQKVKDSQVGSVFPLPSNDANVKPCQRDKSVEKIRQMKQKNTSSLFIRRPVRKNKKVSESSTYQVRQAEDKEHIQNSSDQRNDKLTEKKVPTLKKEKYSHQKIEILPAESVKPLLPKVNKNSDDKKKVDSEETVTEKEDDSRKTVDNSIKSNDTANIAKSEEEPHNVEQKGFLENNIDKVPIEKWNSAGPNINREDMLELELLSGEFVNDENQVNGDEPLMDDQGFDEDELYRRIFPWIAPRENNNSNTSNQSNQTEEQITIEGLNLNLADDDDDDDDDDLLVIEKPIISESILNDVKDKLAYEIDNEPIEEINTQTEGLPREKVEHVDITHEPSASIDNSDLKSNLKGLKLSKGNTTDAEEGKEREEKPRRKSVKFSETIQVKEVENISEEVKQKLEVEKLYKDVFGEDYQKIQEEISANMATYGTSVPNINTDNHRIIEINGFDSNDATVNSVSSSADNEEEEDVSFHDIVSTRIVENQVIDAAFTNKDEHNQSNETMTNSAANKDDNLTLRRNTRKNKNKVSRFKQLKMNNAEI